MATNERKAMPTKAMATNERKAMATNERKAMATNERKTMKKNHVEYVLSNTDNILITIGGNECCVYGIYESEKYIYFSMSILIDFFELHLRSMAISKETKKLFYPKNGDSKYSSYYFFNDASQELIEIIFPELFNA